MKTLAAITAAALVLSACAITQEELMSLIAARYERDVKTAAGRKAWHGARVSWTENVTNLTVTTTHADGTVFVDSFDVMRPISAAARLAELAKREAERKVGQLPPDLQDVARRRIENAARTNEVGVTYTTH